MLCSEVVNYLNFKPDSHIFPLCKMKPFADDKLNVTQNIKFDFHWVENIVGNGEDAGGQYFLLCRYCFQTSFSSSVESCHCVGKAKSIPTQ